MDEIVKQAMAKWPNVPHCYGWLGLDARGNWRMRDERAQHFNEAGDKLTNPALVGFITRNYQSDERGCWYFQNGPQRVYLNLEATPFIARTDPAQGFVLHTGVPLGEVDAAWLTEAGELLLRSGATLAQLDDRDFAQVLPMVELNGRPVGDNALLAWLDAAANDPAGLSPLTLRIGDRAVPLAAMARDSVATTFRFERLPQPA
ncbi:DUF2946 family protein [Pseudoduganella sp. OTU4001]|uniref:DUF2946 family protein n=1 Tax=Pseudoduganella sp. OTU4001 TaxID=3043854 RepID=UPI00313CD970